MRVFTNMVEAHSEIQRDLSKSPEFVQTRVQHLVQKATVREAMNYAYTIMNFPDDATELVDLMVQRDVISATARQDYIEWLNAELSVRLDWYPGVRTEFIHPNLRTLLEGSEPSYSYSDRLRGAIQGMAATLAQAPDTRRAFWPIFQPEDAVRAPRLTRVPCSLGYQATIRHVNGEARLHLTYLMRSCDFGHFWWTDLWLAREFQKALRTELLAYSDVVPDLGHLTHIVLSLHDFIDGEIY